MSRGSGGDQIVTATLQSVAYQTQDLISSMAEDGISPAVIRVDGGMVANNWFLQFLADVLDTPVERPVKCASPTVLGGCISVPRSLQAFCRIASKFSEKLGVSVALRSRDDGGSSRETSQWMESGGQSHTNE